MDKARRDIRALSLEELRRFFTSNAVPAFKGNQVYEWLWSIGCLLYTSPSPRDRIASRMPSSA